MKLRYAMAAALAAAAAPAYATDFTFAFSGSSSTSGTDGNVRTFIAINGLQDLQVKATGWSIDGSTIRDSYLGLYGGGLGVTSGDEDGTSSTHTVDNQNRFDFILLHFDEAVSLKSATFNTFGDTDASIDFGTIATPWGNVLPYNDATLATLNAALGGAGFQSPGPDAGGTRNLAAANQIGNLWLIAADTSGVDADDRFKLGGLTASTTALPEPATWAMMITGFGLIGGSLRARRRKPIVSFA